MHGGDTGSGSAAGPEWVWAGWVSAATTGTSLFALWALPLSPSRAMVPGPSSDLFRHLYACATLACACAVLATAWASFTTLRRARRLPTGSLARTVQQSVPGVGAYLALAAAAGVAFAAGVTGPRSLGILPFVVMTLPVTQWLLLGPGGWWLRPWPAATAGLMVPAAGVSGFWGVVWARFWFLESLRS